MSDSDAPKKRHGISDSLGVWIIVLSTWGTIVASYVELRERHDILKERFDKAEKQIEDMERDRSTAAGFASVGERLAHVETKLDSVSSDVKELKEKRR